MEAREVLEKVKNNEISIEEAEKYFKKGQMVGVVGRLQVRSWDDNEGKRHWTTEVVVENQEFAESKASASNNEGGFQPQAQSAPTAPAGDGFMNIPDGVEDVGLPFNF